MEKITVWLNIANRRKILKGIVILFTLVSVYFGLNAVFIDLYNPGSLDAKYNNDITNYLFVISIIVMLPLLIEKIYFLRYWIASYEILSLEDQQNVVWKAVKPVIIQVCFVLLLVLIASIVLSWYWQIPPDVIQNYTEYYSPKYQYINNKTINYTMINLSLK